VNYSELSPVVVTDVHIPFWSLVWLIIKLWLAALVASMLLGAIGALIVIILSVLGVGVLDQV
jgi:hypothetical protein